ncbi:MAG: hypothetical protein ACOX52_20880 [Verrucomicrobiota bacterium]
MGAFGPDGEVSRKERRGGVGRRGKRVRVRVRGRNRNRYRYRYR